MAREGEASRLLNTALLLEEGTPCRPTGLLRRTIHEEASTSLPRDTGRFGNVYWRFTIVFALLVLAIGTLPVWLPFAAPRFAAVVLGSVSLSFSVAWAVVAVNAVRNYRRLNRCPVPQWKECVALRSRTFRHVVIVPCYLDPLPVLHCCLDTLAMQRHPERLVVAVAFEARTPDLAAKMRSVSDAFESRFGDLLILVHELDPSVEIAGGCSNKNFALREAFKHLAQRYGDVTTDNDNGGQRCRYTLTTCDTDSKFHPSHFEVLESAYNTENPTTASPVRMCVWQPPLFYTWDLGERPFFNRVTCLMRTMMMLGGLISFNLNPMSIFSYPLELGLRAGFINPRYGVDDIIAKVRWMCDTNSNVPVRLLPVVAISGPTIGTTLSEEVTEWGRQIRRWIVGASESFHYFVIHWRGRPFLSGLVWFATFFTYYGVLLCAAGIFNVLLLLPVPQDRFSIPLGGGLSLEARGLGLVALALQMVAFIVAFALDAHFTRSTQLDRGVHPLRNLLHWLVAPLVLLVYSLIAFVSILRFVVEGKKMAKHDMAAKAGLKTDADEKRSVEDPSTPDWLPSGRSQTNDEEEH